MSKNQSNRSQNGFTIVELLVVVVVIGILAAVTVVSYIGIQQKAVVALLQSNLTNGSQQLRLYQVTNGAYPNFINDCPTPATSNICLKASPGNIFTYNPNNSVTPQTFTLYAASGSTVYSITNESPPVAIITTPITGIAAITGTTKVGSMLTAGALTPSGATVSYQWQSSLTSDGTYIDISGATSATYALVMDNWTKYIKVVATGTGSYTGTQTSIASTMVTTSYSPP